MGFNQNKLLGTLLLALAQFASATTWYVNGVTGNDSNNCKSATTACKTIGHAISLASSGDGIKVAAARYKENLTIDKSLNVVGAHASTTIIDGGNIGTVVTISSADVQVTLAGVTIQNGNANSSGATGGGISNGGILTIKDSTITGNSAVSGGGIYNSGKMAISNSTISRNSAFTGGNAYGGGIESVGTLTISNSTVSGNTASSDGMAGVCGGGIESVGTLMISSSTISGNFVSSAYGGAYTGGICATATLQNSIVANNLDGNCSPYNTITSEGYNLSSDGFCNLSGPGDLNNTDPKLGHLQNNGGPTQTQALLSGSPAIDAGNPSGCTDGSGHLLKTDQRGKPRPDKEDTGGCDMGAFEQQSD